MPLISMRQLLDHAAAHDYGVPAYSVNNLEQTRAIMEAAQQTNSPAMLTRLKSLVLKPCTNVMLAMNSRRKLTNSHPV